MPMFPLDETFNMQVNYPKKIPKRSWDRVNLEYPVRKHPGTGVSSETVGRKWRDQPEILKETVKYFFRSLLYDKIINSI